ncbi:COR domain-containing protein [Vibrio sp. 10N.286.51.F4]|uniref:COR domain-containing protein n=1 Tax=Vibrio sp. 10N.286.51.F4 TaxID=3229710 RepID=UPI0035509F0B
MFFRKKIDVEELNTENLVNLEEISYSSNDIIDTSMLDKSFPKLTKISTYSNCSQEDLDEFSKISRLTQLKIKSPSIPNGTLSLDNIKKLSKLKHLSIETSNSDEEFLNIESLLNLEKIEYLSLKSANTSLGLSLLSNLKNLTSLALRLDLQDSNLRNISHLKKIKSLTIEDYGNCKLHSIKGIESLTSLKRLILENLSRVSNFDSLKNFSNLETLKIYSAKNSNRKIEKIRIPCIPSLKSLIISGEVDLNTLYNTPNICSLSINGNIDICNNQLLPLNKLSSLNIHKNDYFTELKPLLNIKHLNTLYISDCNKLTSLNGISNLPNLKKINFICCDNLTDLSPLKETNTIDIIDIWRFGPIYLDWDLSKKLFFENTLSNISFDLSAEHIPAELTADMNLTDIHSWYSEILEHGYSTPKSVKVMILGNGRIGKTQLARRLRGKCFDSTVPSTHGIQIHQFNSSKTKIKLQSWDFGGQDVYLGTHSLFIDNRALFLVLWTPESENNDLVTCEDIAIRNRPLSYWLAYLKSLAGNKANVIICQSQCDLPIDDKPAPIPHPHPIEALAPISISTYSDDGLEIFWPTFNRAIDRQITKNGETWIPNSWLKVEEEIDRITDQKTMPFEKYKEICNCYDVMAPDTLLTYLHQSGKVFYRSGCFNNNLILDQEWALQGVYLLLEREDALPHLFEMGGKFSMTTIERLLWKGEGCQVETHDNRLLFIEMMTQCGVCFEIQDGNFIAPDALPPKHFKRLEIDQIWQQAEANYHVKLKYDFLHDATMRYLLSKIGENAKVSACYWKYGCCYFDSKHKARVMFDCRVLSDDAKSVNKNFENYGQPGYINIEIQSPTDKLIKHLVESISEINHLGAKAEIEWLKGEPEEKEYTMKKESESPFSLVGEAVTIPNIKPTVYFSYAWGNEQDPKQIVCDQIFSTLLADDNLSVFRDKESMESGDSIEDFEKQIGRADYVLMIISEKSLYHSEHCMNELRLIHERSQQDKESFVKTVIPVIMSDARIKNTDEILDVVMHWMGKKESLEAKIQKIGPQYAGAEATNKLKIMNSFICSTSDTLHWLTDLVIDRTSELQVDTAVNLVKKLIAESK